MKISIVTACLNAESTVKDALLSALNQGELFHEYILVDGVSTDATLEIANSLKPRFSGKLKIISEPDTGIYDALNKGISCATGTHIFVLGADDVLIEGAFERLSAYIPSQSNLPDYVYGNSIVIEPGGYERTESPRSNSKRIGSIPRAMVAGHQASLYSRKAYQELGLFDLSFKIAADYDFYLRFLESGKPSLEVPIAFAKFSLEGLSATQGSETAKDYCRVWIKHGISPLRAQLVMWRSLFNLKVFSIVRKFPHIAEKIYRS